MSWGEIKKAINSTIGTEEFKPLDEMILGQKKLVASDNLLVQDMKTRFYDRDLETVYNLFKMNTSGSIRVKVYGRSINDDGFLSVYINGTYSTGITVETTEGEYTIPDISVKKGDVIGFNAYSANGRRKDVNVEWTYIYADVVDGSLIDKLD